MVAMSLKPLTLLLEVAFSVANPVGAELFVRFAGSVLSRLFLISCLSG